MSFLVLLENCMSDIKIKRVINSINVVWNVVIKNVFVIS